MKKILAVVLSLALMVPGISSVSVADTTSIVEKTVQALGIMTGDENGDMNLSKTITRAEFTAMLVSASSYKDRISYSSNTSVFKDVSYTYWAAQHIRVAVNAGWISGYIDGTFRPDSAVTLEEAAAMTLKLLGYDSSNLYGAYPTAYLEKFAALGLDDGITATKGEALTREDAMYLFYNLMSAQTASGTIYGETLGYSLDTSGHVNYTSVISEDIKGPFVIGDTSLSALVPFSIYTASIYRNDAAASISDIEDYDVVYYNSVTKTVWAYSNKVFGLVTAISPNAVSPSAVTVGGNSYTLGTSEAVEKFSSSGEFSTGDTVTLLFGMNGEVVDVVPASAVDFASYGVVLGKTTSTYQDASGKNYMVDEVSVVTTDGVVRSFSNATDASVIAGQLVSVSYLNGETTIKVVSKKSVTGTFDFATMKLGAYTLADDVEIIDVNSDGSYKVIYPSRLDGKTLNSTNVLYYGFNENQKIAFLILNDATGDLNSYGLVTKVQENEVTLSTGQTAVGSYTYTYLVDGSTRSATTTAYYSAESTGGVCVKTDDGVLDDLEDMKRLSVNAVSALSVTSGSLVYSVSDDVQVYYYDGSRYTLTTLSAVSNLDAYTLTAYVDKGFSAGGLVRVVLARNAE
ncbi:MAG: hypothetical protein PWQ12_730 [Clostridiales bacterium]|nr:hypothetical protein [Clostridiales bacterium]